MKFSTYDNSYIGKTYHIQINFNGESKYILYIGAMSFTNLCKEGGLMVNQKQLPNFISTLNEAKAKFEEWTNTAKENNIKDLSKMLAVTCKVDGFFMFRDWHFHYGVNLQFEFKITEHNDEVKYLLVVRTGRLELSVNRFMRADGFVLVFVSTNEVDTFANKISIMNISEFINKPKDLNLFKN